MLCVYYYTRDSKHKLVRVYNILMTVEENRMMLEGSLAENQLGNSCVL